MTRLFRVLTSIASSLLFFLTPLDAQQKPPLVTNSDEQLKVIADALKQNSYALRFVDGQLSGAGAEFLQRQTSEAQFVLFGEEHYVKEFPLLLSSLFADLHDKHGFNYLAVESDPLSAHLCSIPPLRGDLKSLGAYASAYPNAFTFPTDQELHLFADVGRISTGKVDAVWGVDQSFGALHALARLRELPGFREVPKFNEMYAAAKRIDSVRFTQYETHFLSHESHLADWEELRSEMKPAADSEAAFILNNLVSSSTIWSLYSSNQGYRSWSERETQMKELFLREYRMAQAEGEPTPKVLVTMAHDHIFRGLGPNQVSTLGNFVSEFATANGMKSFSVGVYVRGPWRDMEYFSRLRGLKPIAHATDPTQWTIIDFRPVRAAAATGQFGSLDPDLAMAIYGFDAALVIGPASEGSWTMLLTTNEERTSR